jgi:hypothetical protein
MNFYIDVGVVLIFLCWVIYFQHTVDFGQGKRNIKNETWDEWNYLPSKHLPSAASLT